MSLTLFFLAGLFSTPSQAARELPSDSDHRGIVSFGAFEVFPENRVNNAIYQEGRLLLTVPGQVIKHILPLAEEGRFAYLTQDEAGQSNIGIHMKPDDPKPKIKIIAPGIFFVVNVMEGVVYKKMYRVVQNDTIVDLLQGSKTADGAVAGKNGVMFYHVAGINRSEADGKPLTEFKLRLHLLLYDDERLRHLDYPLVNTLPSLKLAWENETSITYGLADGRMETLSIAQFQ